MKFSEIRLPSNRNFGFFFTFVFALASIFSYNATAVLCVYTFGVTSLLFLIITIVKADILLPLNKLWIRFGLLLGVIISPIVLGIIFFGLFTPVAFVMRFNGRDELRLKFYNKPTHWISRSETIKSGNFKNQF